MPQGKRGSEIDQLAVEYSNQVVDQEADRQGVPRDFARKIAGIESSDRADVITGGRRSSAGAIGKMQLMPGTAKDLGVDPYNIDQNIAGGVKYLGQQLKSFGGDQRLAAAAYNAGPGNVRKYKGVPPFAETQKYAANFSGGNAESEIDKLAREFNGQQSAPLTPAKPPAKRTQPLKKPDTTSPFSFTRPTGFAAAERAVADLELSPEAQAQANKQNQAYNAYSQRSLGGRLAEDATLAAARAGEWAQQTGQRTLGVVGGLGQKLVSPQVKGISPIDIRSEAGKAAQEATAQRLAERETAAPDPSSKIRRGLIQGALQAPVYAAAAELGGIPALAALNVAQEDFKDPLRSGARAIANTVVPLAGGKLGQMAVSPLAKGLSSGANAATRYAGEAVGGAATNVAQTAAEQRFFDGKIDPRELVSQAVIGGVLSPAMARGGVRRQVAADQAQMKSVGRGATPEAVTAPLTDELQAPAETPAPLNQSIPRPRLASRTGKGLPIVRQRTAPLTEPLVPNAPETTRMPEAAPIGAETARTPEPVTAPETTRVTSPEEARVTDESPQQKRNRLISANKQRADAAADSYQKAFESGDYEGAERALREQKRYLSDIKSQIGNKAKTPGDSAVRARIDGELGAIGNRMGEVRAARREAIKLGNQPTKGLTGDVQDTTLIPSAKPIQETVPFGEELNAPTERELSSSPLLDQIANPEGGVPRIPTDRVDFTKLAERQERGQDNRFANKGLLARIRELGGIKPGQDRGELQGAIDKKYPGLINKAGISADQLVQYLQEDGYPVDRNDLNTLWRAIDDDLAGKNVRPLDRNMSTDELMGEGYSDFLRQQESEDSGLLNDEGSLADEGTGPVTFDFGQSERLPRIADQPPSRPTASQSRGTERLRPATRVPEANTGNIKALEARYENATRTINERPDSVSQDLRDYRRELGAAIGEYRRANQSADSRALRKLPRPTPEQLVKQGERDAIAAREAREYFRNAKPPETGALAPEASPRPQAERPSTAPLDATQPERVSSGRLGMENEISQAERDAISRRVSKKNPQQLDAALRDAEAARNEDIAKPQMGGMTRRLAGAYRDALNDRRKQFVKEKALPAKAPLTADESIGLKWSRDEEFGAEARAFKEDFGRWPEDLSELQTGEPRQAKQESPTIQHERFGEVKVTGKASDGKLLVEDADGNPHTIKNPRTAGGNRTASFTRKPLTEELAIPVAEQVGVLPESAVGTEARNAPSDRLANLDAPIKQEWLIKGNAPPDLYGARTLQELFKLPGGRQWWEDNGRKFESGMELKPRQSTAELKPSETIEGIDPVNDPQGWRDFLKSIRDKKSEPRSKTVTRYGKEEGKALAEVTKQWDQVRENISVLESKLRKAKKGTPKREEIQGKLSELKQKDSELEAQYRDAQEGFSATETKEQIPLAGRNVMGARFMPGGKGRQGNLYLKPELFKKLEAGIDKESGYSVDRVSAARRLREDPNLGSKDDRLMIQSAIREAKALGSERISVTAIPVEDRGLGAAKTTSRHESVHSAQPLDARYREAFNEVVSGYKSRPKTEIESKILNNLTQEGSSYKGKDVDRLLATEGPAFIASGDAKRLGLTEAEGEAFYKDYIDRVYQAGGFEPLMDLALQSRPTPKYAKMMGEVLSWAAENEKAKNFPTTKPAIVERAEARLKEIAAGRRAGSGAQALLDQAIVTGYKVYKAGMDFVQWSQAAVKDAGDAIRPHLRKAWEQLQTDRQGAFDEARESQNERIAELGERQSAKGVRAIELANQRKQIEKARDILRQEARANQAAGRPIPEGLRKSFQQKTAELQRLRKDEARNVSLRDQAAGEAERLRAGQIDAARAARSGRADEFTQKRENLEIERKAILADQAAMKKAGKPIPDALKKRLMSLDREIKETRKGELKNRVLSQLKEFYSDEGGSALAGFNPPKKKAPEATQPASPPARPSLYERQQVARRAMLVKPANLSSITAESLKQGARQDAAKSPAQPRVAAKPNAPESAQEYFDEQIKKSPWKEPKAALRDAANEEARAALKAAADRMQRGKMDERQKESIVSAADELMLAGRMGDEKALREARRQLAQASRADQGNLRKAAGAVGRGIKESAGFLQTLRYGTDLSFAFRQAAPLTTNAGNIVNTLRAFKHAYHALGRETGEGFTIAPGSKGAESVRKLLESHPRRELAEKAGIELSGTSGPEEMFSSNAAMKIPWIKRTEAANAAFIDYMRLQEFDTFAKRIEASGQSEFQKNEGYRRAAEVINTLTGRTDLGEGKLKQIATAANGIAAAPRLSISRIKQLDPTWIAREWKKNPEVGKQMARQMVGIGSTWGSLLALGAASGAFSVVLDPRDKDFGKIVSGDTRYDITGGALTPAKLMGEIGDFMWQAGKEVMEATPDATKDRKKAQADMVYRLKQYLRGRLGPAASYVADLAVYGEDYDRNPVTPKSVLTDYKNPSFAPRRLLLPLGVEGPIENIQKGRGLKDIAKTTPFEFFGVGARNYDKRNGDLDRESDFIRESSSLGIDFRNLGKKKGEPEELYKARTERVNKWIESEGSRLVNSAEYKNASPEQKEKMLRVLKGRATQQSNLKSPSTTNFAPAAILRSVRQGERRERRNRGRLIFAGEEE